MKLQNLLSTLSRKKTTKNLHYKLIKRAVYYAARLISSQKEKEFKNDDYDNIKKIFFDLGLHGHKTSFWLTARRGSTGQILFYRNRITTL